MKHKQFHKLTEIPSSSQTWLKVFILHSISSLESSQKLDCEACSKPIASAFCNGATPQ